MVYKILKDRHTLVLIFVSSLLFGNAWGLFEYICEEENLFKPYVHVYEHRRGRRIFEGGPGFHEIARKQNVYVCINGPAYLYYARTTKLGQVYEAPQSGVFAHTCEMHNVVPHMNATKVEYVLHLMAVVIYGDKDDYRRPGLQEFTAPYHFNESEYGPGFPEHFQNATSVAVIGDATCTLEKGDDPLILINFTPVWVPVVPPPPPTPPDTEEIVERNNFVCKLGFNELKVLAAAEAITVPPALAAEDDALEPKPVITGRPKFPTAKDEMKVLVNDEPIRPQGCSADIHVPDDYTRRTDLLNEKMTKLWEKMKAGPDLTLLGDKFGEKIFAVRKSLRLQVTSWDEKLKKAKPGSSQEKQIKAKMAALELLITTEREKYYPFLVNLDIAIQIFKGLGLTDDTGKVIDPLVTPPATIGGAAVDLTALKTAAETAFNDLTTAKDELSTLETELLKDLLAIKEAKLKVWKAMEDPTVGVLVTTKTLEDVVANWKLELSQAEVFYGILMDEFARYRQGPLVYPDASESEAQKKKKRRLSYTQRTVSQRFFIVDEGATAPAKILVRRKRAIVANGSKRHQIRVHKRNHEAELKLDVAGINDWRNSTHLQGNEIRRKKRHARGYMPMSQERKVKPLRSIGRQYDDEDEEEYAEEEEDQVDEYSGGLLYGGDDFDEGSNMFRRKRLSINEDNDAEDNEVISSLSKLQMDDLEMEGSGTKKHKRQNVVAPKPVCVPMPKLTGDEGECIKGKPKSEEACSLLAYTTGHQEAFAENSGRTDNWKKEVLDILEGIFTHACPNFYHRQVFLKRLIRAFSFYLTSEEHFNQPPRAGVSKACDAFEAWQTNPLNPIVAERLAGDPTKFREKRKMWDELIEVLGKCKDAKRSLSFVSDIVQNTVRWRFVRPRDHEIIEITPYEEQAERENVFNWIIDMIWKLFSTAHGLCMVGYEDNNPIISSKFYHFFTEDFMLPLQETWVNPRDNLIIQWIFGEFYNGDAEEWMERCMEASYIFSNRESYRPLRGLYVNCKSEHNYFTSGQYKDSQGMYHGANKAVK